MDFLLTYLLTYLLEALSLESKSALDINTIDSDSDN